MGKFEKLKYYLGALKINWKTKYRLVIRNVVTHQDKVSFLLSPKNVFVLVTSSAFFLILLTILLIAFTPLRVYVPGYTNPDEYRNYRNVAMKVDSLEQRLRINQQYIDNLNTILHDTISKKDEMVEKKNEELEKREVLTEEEKQRYAQANELLQEEAEMILKVISEEQAAGNISIPINKQPGANFPLMLPPTYGTITSEFDAVRGQLGININNKRNTLINSIADGVVVYAGFDSDGGNSIIIQHPGNIISVYKQNETLLKNKGSKVKRGETIAKMGNSGATSKDPNLYFELWYNGLPVNPLEYIIIN